MTGVFIVKVLLHRVFGYLTMFLICAIMTFISLVILHIFFKETPLVTTPDTPKYHKFAEEEESVSRRKLTR